MNKICLFLAIVLVAFACNKNDNSSSGSVTVPVVVRLSSCDSIKQGLLKSFSDSTRLLTCINIQGCDSIRFGLLKPNTQDTLRLLSCIKISVEDSLRIGLLTIGKNYQGGIIGYFLMPGDPGYDANKKHGLIVATKDEFFLDGRWGLNDHIAKTEYAIGSGLANTNKIIQVQGGNANKYAAFFARSRRDGGYSDWFLPSRDELSKLCSNKVAIGMTSGATYWSSSEDIDKETNAKAWAVNFGSCSIQIWFKQSSQFTVRAVRYF
jgi:hypothetical protein